jgi:hypothetical protein
VILGSVGVGLVVMFVAWFLRLSAPAEFTGAGSYDNEYRLLPWLLVAPLAAIGGGVALLKTFSRLKHGVLTMHWRDVTYRVDIQTGEIMQIIR